jgi:hypothetical protein
MSGVVDSIFGIKTSAQKQAEAQQAQAQQIQQRQLYASQESQAQTAAEQVGSGRRLRGLGRQALAFQGNTLGVGTDLTGGANPGAAS